MAVYKADALTDERWGCPLGHHPKGSVFHTEGWLKALRLTYGHKIGIFPNRNSIAKGHAL